MITVIKLGGSLLSASALPACLDTVERYPGNILLVPGGGVFADQVRLAQRQWGFDDVAAHRMAILAMGQMALLFNSLKPDFALFDSVLKIISLPKVAVWSPDIDELDEAGIVPSWDITSDSLAAWLAGRVKADALLLVKSCSVDEGAALTDLQQGGVIDVGFVSFVAGAGYKTRVINKDRFLSIS